MTPRCKAALAIVVMILTSSQGATAQDADRGRRIAEVWCVECHDPDAGKSKPFASGAPTFTMIAKQPEMTALALRVFLQTPHDRMPNLILSRDEIEDLIAYIESFRLAPR